MSYSDKRKLFRLLLLFISIVLMIEIVFCTALGAADIPFFDAVKSVFAKTPLLKDIINTKSIKETHIMIITQLRLPRVLLAGLIGSALSVTGASFQGIFKNPLADPYVIGASSGGALGAAAAIIINSRIINAGFSIIPVFAFVGALGTTYIVYMLGKVKNRVSITSVILSGVALNSMLSSVLSLILLFNKEQMSQILFWTMGGFSTAGWDQVVLVAPGIIIGMALIYVYSRDLNAMLLGEESAKHLGINTDRLKKVMLFTGAFITGLSVSVSGVIGFVGIVIPHIFRIVLGPDNHTMIPFTAIGGAMFLMAADALSRILIPSTEIPVGILTAAVGGPFFIYLLIKNKKKLI